MFKSSLIICWNVPYKRPNLPAISKMVLCLHSQFVNQHIFNCVICGEMTWILVIFGHSFCKAHLWKPLRCLFFLWHCQQNLWPMCCSSISTNRESQITLYTHTHNTNKHPVQSSAEIWLQNSLDWLRRYYGTKWHKAVILTILGPRNTFRSLFDMPLYKHTKAQK